MSRPIDGALALALCQAMMIAIVKRNPSLAADLTEAIGEVALSMQQQGEAPGSELAQTLWSFCSFAFEAPDVPPPASRLH